MVSFRNTRREERYPSDKQVALVIKRVDARTLHRQDALGQFIDYSRRGFRAVTRCPVRKDDMVTFVSDGRPMTFSIRWVLEDGHAYTFGCEILDAPDLMGRNA